jgi:hypothetical protein
MGPLARARTSLCPGALPVCTPVYPGPLRPPATLTPPPPSRSLSYPASAAHTHTHPRPPTLFAFPTGFPPPIGRTAQHTHPTTHPPSQPNPPADNRSSRAPPLPRRHPLAARHPQRPPHPPHTTHAPPTQRTHTTQPNPTHHLPPPPPPPPLPLPSIPHLTTIHPSTLLILFTPLTPRESLHLQIQHQALRSVPSTSRDASSTILAWPPTSPRPRPVVVDGESPWRITARHRLCRAARIPRAAVHPTCLCVACYTRLVHMAGRMVLRNGFVVEPIHCRPFSIPSQSPPPIILARDNSQTFPPFK